MCIRDSDNRFVCWGTGFEDFDNDGWQDISVATGHIYPELESRFPDSPYKSPLLLYRNLGHGHFEELFDEAGTAILTPHSSRGIAYGDFDNDGDIDMLVVNLGEPPSLFRNDVSEKNHWIKIRPEGTVSNRSAIGARIEITANGMKLTKEQLSPVSYTHLAGCFTQRTSRWCFMHLTSTISQGSRTRACSRCGGSEIQNRTARRIP